MNDQGIKCSYCGVVNTPENTKYAVIISPNWKSNNYRSPQRPYCKDKPCASYDQMAHEG